MSWWTHSESDPRWNACSEAGNPSRWIAVMRQCIGAPPNDLEWGYAPQRSNKQRATTMDIHIHSYNVREITTCDEPNSRGDKRLYFKLEGFHDVLLWVSRDQAHDIRLALDVLFPPAPLEERWAGTAAYAAEHHDEFTTMGGGE